jgi:HIP---CoA ligase
MSAESTIPGIVRSGATQWPELRAIVDGPAVLTYAELPAVMRQSARAAMAAGISRGKRAAIWAPNTAEWIIASLGVMAAGGAIVPVSTRFKENEAAYVLGKSGAKVCFIADGFLGIDFLSMLESMKTKLPDLEQVVVIRSDRPTVGTSWSDYLAAGEDVPDEMAEERELALCGEDVADVLFTSGTTGRPKGVMTTHQQNVSVFEVYTRCLGLRPDDQYLIVNPFFHSFGYKAGWLSSILTGATIFPHQVFDIDAVLRRIQEDRISVLPGPPTVLSAILDHPGRSRYDLSSLRLTCTGSANVPVELIRRLQGERIFETVLTAYGLTETSGVVSVCERDDDPETVANWSGRPIPGVEVRVVDDAGRTLAPLTTGELLVRGYNVMRGYLDDPEGTASAIDPGGWLHTGDIGMMDERGYLKVTDRKKDMYIVGGFNAYPAEIEGILLESGMVSEVAVIGIPDARLGQVGMAFVVQRPGVAVEPDRLLVWAKQNMANFKVPRRVEVVDHLPINASGKVDKGILRAMVATPSQG